MKDRIRQLMDAQHMNQQTFAACTGIGVASLSSIFTGRTNPTLKHVDAIINKFPNVNPMWLLKGMGSMLLTTDQMAAAISEDPSTPLPDSTSLASGSTNGGQSDFGGDLFGSANMSADATTSSATDSSTRGGQTMSAAPRSTSPSFHFTTDKRIAANNASVFPTPQRKITEIRIFYDDQTWETFVPKK